MLEKLPAREMRKANCQAKLKLPCKVQPLKTVEKIFAKQSHQLLLAQNQLLGSTRQLSQLRYAIGQIKNTNGFGTLQPATVSLGYSSKAQTRSWHDMHWALVGSIYVYSLAFLQAILQLGDILLS